MSVRRLFGKRGGIEDGHFLCDGCINCLGLILQGERIEHLEGIAQAGKQGVCRRVEHILHRSDLCQERLHFVVQTGCLL